MLFTAALLRGVSGALILLSVGVPSDPPSMPVTLREKDPPAAWKLSELNAFLPNSDGGGSVTILVWEVIEFDGVFTDEERCLVLKQYEKPTQTGHRYAVGILSRQPKTEKPVWKPNVQHSEELGPDRRVKLTAIVATGEYKNIPTDDELRAFLKKHAWQEPFTPSSLFLRMPGVPTASVHYTPKVVDGGVCKGAWKKLLGREVADGLFPELVPQIPENKVIPRFRMPQRQDTKPRTRNIQLPKL
jgi:hypothetical protein